MSISSDFWERLFSNGSMVFDGPPLESLAGDRDVLALLERNFRKHVLAIAGPSLPFVGPVALEAARVVEWSAWYVVSEAGTPEDMERTLTVAARPAGAADHLSADLALQYLPCVHRRARTHFPADRLPALLENILRRWPLSGVLADLPEGPLDELEFGSHPGLLFLYAERFANHFNPAWLPRGPGASYVELVWTELGRDPALLTSLNHARIHGEEPNSD